MHFENQHSNQYNFYVPFITDDANYPEHFHADYELLYLIDGTVSATISGYRHNVTKGEFILVFPNQAHAYVASAHSKCFICIFSADMIASFTRMTHGKVPVNPVFTVEDMSVFHSLIMYRKQNTLLLQSLLYYICSQFMEQCSFREVLPHTLVLQNRIADEVAEHFTENITLQQIAMHLGYSYSYLSRFFSSNFSMNFRALVNQYRIDLAEHLLEETEETITSLALLCGFENTRSFNRTFLNRNGITPSQYRSQHRHELPRS